MPARTVSTAAGAADWDQLNSLTNLNDINRLLHETIAYERSIEADLDKQLGKRTDLEREILQLNAATSEVCILGQALQQVQHWARAAWLHVSSNPHRSVGSSSHSLWCQHSKIRLTLQLVHPRAQTQQPLCVVCVQVTHSALLLPACPNSDSLP